jgi:putative hydrolase of the HAD superfamily
MINEVKAVIFDVDDTLFDRDKAQREILRLMIQKMSDVFAGIDEQTAIDAFLESDSVALQEYYDNPDASGDVLRARRSEAFLGILGLDESSADRITNMYVESYPTLDVPVEDAKSVVKRLSEKFQLGVVSNGFPDVQYQKLKTLGIESFFDCILLSEEIGIRKPDPRIFWRAASLMLRQPEECLYIGDSYRADVPGAKRAGMQACWFNPHGLRPSQEGVKPDFEISALHEILSILDNTAR